MTTINNTTARQVALEALLVNSHSKTTDELADALFVGALRGRCNAAKKSAKENAGKEYDAAATLMKSLGMTQTLPQTRGEFMNSQVAKWDRIVFDLDAENKDAEADAEAEAAE